MTSYVTGGKEVIHEEETNGAWFLGRNLASGRLFVCVYFLVFPISRVFYLYAQLPLSQSADVHGLGYYESDATINHRNNSHQYFTLFFVHDIITYRHVRENYLLPCEGFAWRG